MKPGVKLAAFTLVLAVAFGGGTALGAAFAPEPAPPDHTNMPGMDHTNTTMDPNMPGMDHSKSPASTQAP